MPQQVPTVSAAEVPEDAVVLDVREDDEWVHGHIEGATHIAMGDVPARLDEIPDGDPLYVTCRGGGRSARVAAWLNQNGFDAVNVAGGMGEAEAAGRPMGSETGPPPLARGAWGRGGGFRALALHSALEFVLREAAAQVLLGELADAGLGHLVD